MNGTEHGAKSTNKYITTDMAVEKITADSEGVKVTEESLNGFHVHRLTVEKPCDGIAEAGRYITVTVGRPWLDAAEKTELAAELLSRLIRELCLPPSAQAPHSGAKEQTLPSSALILCLGNRRITADAVGPLCLDGLIATRHLRNDRPDVWRDLGRIDLSAIATGVAGETGLDACELAVAAVNATRPSIVIAVDALSARNTERLGTSIQLSDTGISPGSGVGNRRRAICEKTLGVPVISIGVPTVAHSATLIRDALEIADNTVNDRKTEEALNVGREFFVTPRDCDVAVSAMADIISRAVNLAFLGFQKL